MKTRSRAYFETEGTGGVICVPLYNRPLVHRPNKNAAGMSHTDSRSERAYRVHYRRDKPTASGEARLTVIQRIVHGSNDKLARSLWMFRTKQLPGPCPCCGSFRSEKFRLDPKYGKPRLERLRKRRAARMNPGSTNPA